MATLPHHKPEDNQGGLLKAFLQALEFFKPSEAQSQAAAVFRSADVGFGILRRPRHRPPPLCLVYGVGFKVSRVVYSSPESIS